ncbi:uncharacterized protein [Onthophagus taurus]|uniref:uncharacterized protein n=1 Tax=Onthophagus taurus TaxID=166361 RepID=UPI0039BDAD66
MAKFISSNISGIVQPEIFAWSDSMVVLNWLDSSPHRWKTFLTNRTSHIHVILPGNRWRYVQSKDNPADPGSRGLLPSEMIRCKLWWNEPAWLSSHHSQWPSKSPLTCPDESISEEKRVVIVNIAEQIEEYFLHTLMNSFSDLNKIQNIIAYILRFVAGCRKEPFQFINYNSRKASRSLCSCTSSTI